MTDPRNVAHDKKVMHDKHNEGIDTTHGTGHEPQPGKKAPMPPEETQSAGHNPADTSTPGASDGKNRDDAEKGNH